MLENAFFNFGILEKSRIPDLVYGVSNWRERVLKSIFYREPLSGFMKNVNLRLI